MLIFFEKHSMLTEHPTKQAVAAAACFGSGPAQDGCDASMRPRTVRWFGAGLRTLRLRVSVANGAAAETEVRETESRPVDGMVGVGLGPDSTGCRPSIGFTRADKKCRHTMKKFPVAWLITSTSLIHTKTS